MANKPESTDPSVEQQLADALALVNSLTQTLDTASQQLQTTTQQRDHYKDQYDHYKDQYEWLRIRLGLVTRQIFGASSERSMPSQEGLFDEAEALQLVGAAEVTPEPTEETLPRRIKKTRGASLTQVAELPVEIERLELPEAERHCAHCNHDLHEMGEEVVSSKLEIVPARFFIRRQVQVKYACRYCANHDVARPPVVVPLPASAFPGSMASPSAVAHIVTQKFELGVPLYRQEQYFTGRGLELTRQTQANWVIRCAGLLAPIHEHMHTVLLRQPVLHADETVVQVLREEERKPQTQSRMWVYCTGGLTNGHSDGESPPLVLYDYQPTRGSQHPIRFLEGFSGYLHVDGYEAYEKLANGTPGGVTLAGCWSHARRKFEDAIKILPQSAKQKGGTPAHMGREFCNRLFAIERKWHDFTPQERYQRRLEQSAPVLAEFKTWLQEQGPTITPKSLLGSAVGYCLNQWGKLVTFLLDGRIALDNNRIERAIKPFVIGRKNWLFCNTPRGAQASATLYSLIETAKLNGLVPQT